jgi:hypothetical protein
MMSLPAIRHVLIACSVLSCLAWGTTMAQPHDLIANGQFDQNISGWDLNEFVPEPNARWVSEDALGDPSSGSAELDNIGTGNNSTQLGLALCLPATAGLPYEAGAMARMTAPTADGLPMITVTAHDTPNCTTSPPLHTSWLTFGFVHEWTGSVQSFVAPPGTIRLQVFVGVTKSAGVTETLSARFDNIYLLGDDTQFHDRFELP